jgi:hypothetical protein
LKLRIPLTLTGLAALAAAAWFALRPPDLAPITPADSSAAAAPAGQSSRAAAGGNSSTVRPGPAATSARPQFIVKTPARTLFNEFLGAKEYRILYDRLANSPEGQTAEGKLVMYELLRTCARITDGPRPGYKAHLQPRESFTARIPATDPSREKRLAAYEQLAIDRCHGLDGITMTRADLLKILDDAAAAGDPRARALSMEQAMGENRRNTGGLNDNQVRELQRIAESRDPEAVRVAGRMLANSWPDYSLRVGPDQVPIDQKAFVSAFLVLACEYGAPCGNDTPRMLEACAMRGYCNAQNFPDYLAQYGATPHETALVVQYRELIRQAIETGNWSQITVVRGGPANHRMSFQPGPR